MKDFKIGDVVIVMKNNMGEEWDFLIGEVGTVISICNELDNAEIQFDQDHQWAERTYCCGFDEIELFVKKDEAELYPNKNRYAVSDKDIFNVFSWVEDEIKNRVWIDIDGNIMKKDGNDKPYKVPLDYVCNLVYETESNILKKWREFYKQLDK